MMRISYTFLDLYQKCPKRAYLQYILKVVDFAKIDHRSFIVGIVADWLFEHWAKGGYVLGWMEEQAPLMFKWFTERRYIIYKDGADKEGLLRKLLYAVRLLEDVAYTESLPERNIEFQKEVMFKGNDELEGFDFYGRIDLWFPDESILWDLKITKYTKYLNNFQLYFFAWMLSKVGITVEDMAFLVPLLSPSVRPVEFGFNLLSDIEIEVLDLLEALKNEEKWEANSKDCWGCPVKFHCERDDFDRFDLKRKKDGFSISLGKDIFDDIKEK